MGHGADAIQILYSLYVVSFYCHIQRVHLFSSTRQLTYINTYSLSSSVKNSYLKLYRVFSHCNAFSCSIGSGAMVVLIGIASGWLDSGSDGDKLFMYISQLNKQRSRFPLLSNVQVRCRECFFMRLRSHLWVRPFIK